MSLDGLKSWFLSMFGYDKPEQDRKTAHVEEVLDAAATAVKRQERAIQEAGFLIERELFPKGRPR
jgi:hypothetical protein